MPSPFPGMDPYLEGREWTSVHADLAAELGRQLAPQLSPKYIIRTIRRFIMDTPDDLSISTRDTYPDISVFKSHDLQKESSQPVAIMPPPLQLNTVISQEMPTYSLEIRATNTKSLVTAIEILSPANKRGKGQEQYEEKRENILRSHTHLLEIDLLRKGKRVPMERPLPDVSYFIFLSRVEQRPLTDIWPIRLDSPLPIIPVPLLPEDEDVPLNLQVAFENVYNIYRYDLSLDYTQPSDISFTEAEAQIAHQILQSQQ